MPRFEYKVVPAPKKPGKIKGVKGTDQRFAAELANLMNEFGAQGWEYQRTDTLPCEERQGLTGRTTTFQNMLVFRRDLSSQTQGEASPSEAAATPEALLETPRATPEPVMALPTFQTTSAPAAPAISTAPPEGPAPVVGSPTEAPRHPPGQPPRIIAGGSS